MSSLDQGIHSHSQEYTFLSMASRLAESNGRQVHDQDFPLRNLIHIQSKIGSHFEPLEYRYSENEIQTDSGLVRRAKVFLLTLAGSDGLLPWWVGEKIELESHLGGKELHEFLDIINRRFWELLFVSSGVGHLAHIPFSIYKQKNLIDSLTFSLANTEQQNDFSQSLINKSLMHSIRQLAWSSPGNIITGIPIENILSKEFGVIIKLRKRVLTKIPVSHRCLLTIGDSFSGFISRKSSVIGRNAIVYGGIEMQIVLNDSSQISDYTSLNTNTSLQTILKVMQLIYAQVLPTLILRLCFESSKLFSRIGNKECRLGFGAMVSNLAESRTSLVVMRRVS